jgi:hypothetical protein
MRLRLDDDEHPDAGRSEPVGVAGHLAEVGDARDSDEMAEKDDE